MKHFFILFMMSLCFSSNAEVKIMENNYSIDETVKGQDYFYGRIYRWSAWEESSLYKSFDVSPNPIKQAHEIGLEPRDVQTIDPDEYLSVFPGNDGEALADYYDEKEPVDYEPEHLGLPYSELVLNAKVTVSLKDDFNFDDLNIDSLAKRAIEADSPHLYSKVDRVKATNLLDEMHLGHKQIDEHPNSEIYVSMFNFAPQYYQCMPLHSALKLQSGRVFSHFRVFNVNLFKELSASEISSRSVIEGQPVRVFEQKLIKSTDILKSAVSYIAFYNNEGGKKLVVYTAVVSTSKVEKALAYFINGFGDSPDGHVLFGKEGYAPLTTDNLSLKSYEDNCSKGLATGVGRYVYRLAKKIVR